MQFVDLAIALCVGFIGALMILSGVNDFIKGIIDMQRKNPKYGAMAFYVSAFSMLAGLVIVRFALRLYHV